MTDGSTVNPQAYLDAEKNASLVLALLDSYFRVHTHSGKIYEAFPDFFLFKPAVLDGWDIATRSSEKLLLNDCIQRAKERNGYIGVSKHRNPKLGYYWLELSVMPFMLGDPVTKNNKGEFFFILTRFIEFTKQNPLMYGDLTAEIDSDKDLALMLGEISNMAAYLTTMLKLYPEQMLVSFNPKWPLAEVSKLMLSLKDNDQDWCEMFFEHLIYAMSQKKR